MEQARPASRPPPRERRADITLRKRNVRGRKCENASERKHRGMAPWASVPEQSRESKRLDRQKYQKLKLEADVAGVLFSANMKQICTKKNFMYNALRKK